MPKTKESRCIKQFEKTEVDSHTKKYLSVLLYSASFIILLLYFYSSSSSMWESMFFQMFRNIFHKLSFLCAFSLQIFLRRRSLVELCRFPLLWIRLRLREASEIPISSRIFRRNVLRAMTGIFQVSWRCPVIRVIIQSVTSVFARPSIELTGDGVKPFAFLARVPDELFSRLFPTNNFLVLHLSQWFVNR